MAERALRLPPLSSSPSGPLASSPSAAGGYDHWAPPVVRLELDADSEPGPESGGALRTRVWSTEGAERTLTLDLRHAPSAD